MKKIKSLFCFVLILVFVSCNVENESESALIEENQSSVRNTIGASCIGEIESSCIDLDFSSEISLAEYPGCTFEVSITGFVCYGLTTTSIHLGEFNFNYDSGCPAFDQAQQDAIMNGALDEFTISLNQEVWRTLTSIILNDELVPTLTTVVNVEYVIGACHYKCGGDILICSDACCRRINKFNKINGNWEILFKGEIEQIGQCISQPVGGCPPDVKQSSSCYNNCSSLNF